MKIALRAANGRYLRAVNGGDDDGLCFVDRDKVGPDETWTLHNLGGDKIALETRTGRFLCAENGGGTTVHANRHAIGIWEQWTRTEGGGLLAQNGRHFLCAEVGRPEGPINANRLSRGPWETWSFDPAESFPRVHAAGRRFALEDGTPWTWLGATNFLLFQRFLEGQDIAPLLYEGFELYRVTSLMAFIPSIVGMRALAPANYPHYWEGLSQFADYLLSHGKRCELTIFADAETVLPDVAAQQDHAARVIATVRDKPNVCIELVNEFPKNGVDPSRFSYDLRSLPAARGSNTGDEAPPTPVWDYSTFHPRRDAKWPVTIPQTAHELRVGWTGYAGVGDTPIVIDEPIGAAETDQPGKRSADPELFFKMAVDCGLWTAGATMHLEDGVFSRPLGPVQQACAEAFRRGLTVGGAR